MNLTREITDHKCESTGHIRIVADGPEGDCPSQVYEIRDSRFEDIDTVVHQRIAFNGGPLTETGSGAVSICLLAILVDRIRAKVKGPFTSREIAIVLTHLETALLWLKKIDVDILNYEPKHPKDQKQSA